MSNKPFRFTVAAAALIIAGSLFWIGPRAEAGPQCLSKGECQELRSQLREHQGELGEQRQELKQTRQQVRECEPGSAEQKQLRRQAREQKRELDQLRQEQQQVKRQVQQRCRNC